MKFKKTAKITALAVFVGASVGSAAFLDIDKRTLLKVLFYFAFAVITIAIGSRNKSVARIIVLSVFVTTLALPLSFSIFNNVSGSIARPLPEGLEFGMFQIVPLLLVILNRSSARIISSPHNFSIKTVKFIALFSALGFVSIFYQYNANPLASLWGAVFIMFMAGLIIITSNNISFNEAFLGLWWGSVGATILQTIFVIAYPILNIHGATTLFSSTTEVWIARDMTPRALGTTDNPNSLGSYLSMLIPIFVASYKAGYNKKLSSFLIMVLLGDIFLTQSRSALVSTIISCVFVFWIMDADKKIIKKTIVVLIASMVPVMLFLFTPWGEMLFMSTNAQDMLLARQIYWDIALNLWYNHPLLGVGLNSQVDYISRNINLGVVAIMGSNFVETNPIHNIYLLVADENGIIGLICWISIYLTIVFRSVKGIVREKVMLNRIPFGFAIGSLIAFLIESLFGWENYRILPWQQISLIIILLLLTGKESVFNSNI
ncbi:MAG: O-antigen ligase family protein [Desulfosporosinus sp.]|nr:O-antigen ligase family protein [Desulfosporosinus sp.]